MHNFATAFWAFPIANVIISTGIMMWAKFACRG